MRCHYLALPNFTILKLVHYKIFIHFFGIRKGKVFYCAQTKCAQIDRVCPRTLKEFRQFILSEQHLANITKLEQTYVWIHFGGFVNNNQNKK